MKHYAWESVKRLVAVGLWRPDIVLEPAQDRLVNVVDHAQDIIAVPYILHNHAEGKEVKDFL